MENPDSYSLRPATPDDLPGICRIESVIMPTPWSLQDFEAELRNPHAHFYVLTDDETDETIAGYLIYHHLSGLHLITLVVDLSFRGLGFAKKMLQHLVRDGLSKSCESIELEVRKSNDAAVNLYQSLGFSVVRILKQFYANGDDAYHMRISLAGETPEETAFRNQDESH